MLWRRGLRPECPPSLAEREIAAALELDRIQAEEDDRSERWAWMAMVAKALGRRR